MSASSSMASIPAGGSGRQKAEEEKEEEEGERRAQPLAAGPRAAGRADPGRAGPSRAGQGAVRPRCGQSPRQGGCRLQRRAGSPARYGARQLPPLQAGRGCGGLLPGSL